jgi:hypothetical protein
LKIARDVPPAMAVSLDADPRSARGRTRVVRWETMCTKRLLAAAAAALIGLIAVLVRL